jgi:hypothetical protein
MAIKSELLWTLSDYRQFGEDPPGRIVSNPELCEGDMMTTEEVEVFVKDSIATLRILSEKHSPRYDEAVLMFVADMAALVSCGQMEEEEYAGLTSEENIHF